MSTPQPIATAPKGKRILLYCPRKVESEGWWQVGTFDEDTCRWIDDDYEPGCMLVQPTYWLPWPPPPTPTQPNTAKSALPTSPVAEESSATPTFGNEADFVTKSTQINLLDENL